MDNYARTLPRDTTETTSLECGRIILAEGDKYTVDTGDRRIMAGKAFSCLVQPCPGDRVLFCREPDGRAYVLSVLEREKTDAALSLPGNVTLSAPEGTLSLAARDGLNLATPGETALASASLSVAAGQAEISLEKTTIVSKILDAHIDALRLVGRTVEHVAERIRQRFARSFRQVDELDQTRAGQVDCKADKVMNLRGKYTVVTAEKDVRVDGEKILMG